jgi:hypothetical protein
MTRRAYRGERRPTGSRVYVLGPHGAERLAPRSRTSLCSYSWGCHDAGSRELAWALIRDATGDRQLAEDWHLDLSIEIVSRLPSAEFRLRASDVVTWLEATPLCPTNSWPSAAIELRQRSALALTPPCAAPHDTTHNTQHARSFL